VKKENVKINKLSGKKGIYFSAHFFLSFGGGLLVKEKKKDIKENGETQLLGSFRFTNGG
jgi:hypothetical protein